MMNRRGQFSIIAALLVAAVLIATVITTYSTLSNIQVQNGPQVMSAMDETNLAIKQILGFAVGYYGSILQVTGNSTYAQTTSIQYLEGGLNYIASIYPSEGITFNPSNISIQAYWFTDQSYSSGSLSVSYNMTGLGIYGITYQPSCELMVSLATATQGSQVCITVTKDGNQPYVDLGATSFKFYNYSYTNSSWTTVGPPSGQTTAFSNGTYLLTVPAGVDPTAYSVEVVDPRGLQVVACSFTSYAYTMDWSAQVYQYISNNSSNVDNSTIIGTQSNFTAEQFGPDSIYDNLTEMYGPPPAYYPSAYNLLGSTSLTSGSLNNLQADDSLYMNFSSYLSATTNQTLYLHNDNTTINGLPYRIQNLTAPNPTGTGTNLSASMSSVGRYLWAQAAYPLQGLDMIPASTWTINYRAWQDNVSGIAFDNQSSTIQTSSSSSISWNHTTGTGNNRLLLVGISVYNSAGRPTTVSGVTYGGTNLTQVATARYSTNPQVRTYVYYLVNPTSGKNTINVTFNSPTLSIAGATTYTGVNQTSPIQISGTNTGSGNVPSVSVTVAGSGCWLFGYLGGYGSSSSWTITEGTNQAERWNQTTGYSYKSVASDKSVSAGSQSMSWSLSSTVSYVATAVVINPISPPVGHADVDVLIRHSNGTYTSINSTVAASATLTATPTTLSATYSWANYTVTNQNDYLEIDYYVDVTSASAGSYSYLRVDDPASSNQTKVTGFLLPSQYVAAVEFSGSSDNQSWTQLVWTVDSLCNVSNVNAVLQLYDYSVGSYPTAGNGYVTDTMGTSNKTEMQTITSSPTHFRDSSGNWKIRINETATRLFTLSCGFVQYQPSSPSYRLNIEEQFTGINCTRTNEQLCIRTGNFSQGNESLLVDVWNSSAWTNVIGSLNATSWNNVTVASYLTGPTLTIRLRDNDTTGSSVQSWWQIDVVLLHFWTDTSLYNLTQDMTMSVEVLQNGTMLWLGQSLVTTQTRPLPPVPVKNIHVNQTINGVNQQVPFQIEDWASDYKVPLGLTSNESIFSNQNMLVYLIDPKTTNTTTIWWVGNDNATQTPYAYTNRYFNDNIAQGKFSTAYLNLTITDQTVYANSTSGNSNAAVEFLRINNNTASYGSASTYTIYDGIVRDVIHQEAEYPNGITNPNCPNVYTDIVITLPANSTYYTYQVRVMFVNSNQARNITQLCAVNMTYSVAQSSTLTENGTVNGYPNVVTNSTSLLYNYSATCWQHHWSQINNTATRGAGIMFTDAANWNLYYFDSSSFANTTTGGLMTNPAAGTMQLLPVSKASTSVTPVTEITWFGAIVTYDGTAPIYMIQNGRATGMWLLVESPPSVTVTAQS